MVEAARGARGSFTTGNSSTGDFVATKVSGGRSEQNFWGRLLTNKERPAKNTHFVFGSRPPNGPHFSCKGAARRPPRGQLNQTYGAAAGADSAPLAAANAG
jgi:hypothetical protein